MPNTIDRRRALAGAAAGLAAWSAPSVLRIDRASASPASCLPEAISWSGGSFSGGQYTINGSSNGLAIQAIITPQLSGGANRSAFLSSGRIGLAMWNHQIGDSWRIELSFSAPGTICTASTTILDVDQNGRGLGCGTNSRFRDEITNVTGTGLTTIPQGNLIENPPGTFGSAVPCKTNNFDNLFLDWTATAGVSGGGFTWVAGTPPGTSQTLDRQIILITPISMCVVGGGGANLTGRSNAVAPDTRTVTGFDSDQSLDPAGAELD